MSRLTDISNETADRLERAATAEKNERTKLTEERYNAYIQACEDFAKELRRIDREVLNDVQES